MPISAQQAAVLLGVSPRKVYGLAAPGGPIPCYRIGRNVNFDETDILEYKQQCRSFCTQSLQNMQHADLHRVCRLPGLHSVKPVRGLCQNSPTSVIIEAAAWKADTRSPDARSRLGN